MESDARPPQKLANKGQWKFWKREFQTYMKITKGYEKPGDEQVAWLKNFIGPIGLNAFEKISFDDPKDEDDMEIVLKKLEEYFDPPKNEIEERHKFFTKSKKGNESIDKYIDDLKDISKHCNFGDQRDKLIRDAVVLDIKDKHLRQLLFEERNLNLEKLKVIYKTYEINLLKIKDVSKEVMIKKPEPEKKIDEPSNPNVKQNFNNNKPCWRCGKRHPPKNCPAWGKNCVYCKQLHHFSHCCPVAKLDEVKITSVSDTPISDETKKKVNSNTGVDKNKNFEKYPRHDLKNQMTKVPQVTNIPQSSKLPSAPSASLMDLKNEKLIFQKQCIKTYQEERKTNMKMQRSSVADYTPPSYSSLYPTLQSENPAHPYRPNNSNSNNQGQTYQSANQSKYYDPRRRPEKPKAKAESECTIS